MKYILYGIALALTVMLASARDATAACTVCHSKNPKMVKMHEELRGTGCFQCHNFQNRQSPEDTKKQQAEDPLCTRCHKK